MVIIQQCYHRYHKVENEFIFSQVSNLGVVNW